MTSRKFLPELYEATLGCVKQKLGVNNALSVTIVQFVVLIPPE